jgi:hypothetical protein
LIVRNLLLEKQIIHNSIQTAKNNKLSIKFN